MMSFIYNAINKRYLKKTIMSKDSAEMYRQDFQERHEKALSQDINNLSDVINAFHDEKVTLWHCCTSDGYGYYTISNGEKTERGDSPTFRAVSKLTAANSTPGWLPWGATSSCRVGETMPGPMPRSNIRA